VGTAERHAEAELVGFQVAEGGFDLHAFSVQCDELCGRELSRVEVGGEQPWVALLFGKDGAIGMLCEVSS